VNPAVRAGGVGGATIRSSDKGIMVDRPGQPAAGPFPDLETASRVAGSIDAPMEKQSLPASAPAAAKEETAMPTCTKAGCKKITRLGKFKAPPPPGTEGFCNRHRKEFLKANATGEKPAKTVRRSKPGPKPAKAKTRATAPAMADEVREQVTTAFEAFDLVTKIGWDVARALAARIDEVCA
jgi:hypothetical protein